MLQLWPLGWDTVFSFIDHEVTTINTIPVRIHFETAAQEMQTSKITNSSGLTMKSDTGQHLQVLRCFDLKKNCLCLKSSIFGEIFIDSGMICVQLNIQRMMWMLMKVICNIHIICTSMQAFTFPPNWQPLWSLTNGSEESVLTVQASIIVPLSMRVSGQAVN